MTDNEEFEICCHYYNEYDHRTGKVVRVPVLDAVGQPIYRDDIISYCSGKRPLQKLAIVTEIKQREVPFSDGITEPVITIKYPDLDYHPDGNDVVVIRTTTLSVIDRIIVLDFDMVERQAREVQMSCYDYPTTLHHRWFLPELVKLHTEITTSSEREQQYREALVRVKQLAKDNGGCLGVC